MRLLACVLTLIPMVMCAKKTETVINVVPYPQSVEIGKGAFKGAGANFNCDQAIDAESARLIRDFADRICSCLSLNKGLTPIFDKYLHIFSASSSFFIKAQ